jgi:hypothetical protein
MEALLDQYPPMRDIAERLQDRPCHVPRRDRRARPGWHLIGTTCRWGDGPRTSRTSRRNLARHLGFEHGWAMRDPRPPGTGILAGAG